MHKEEVLIDIEQRFPLLEASAYQVRIREKARDERKAREQNRDLTRYDLIIGDQRYSNLPKRRLIYQVVQETIRRGAAPRDVLDLNKAWIIVQGKHDQDSFEAAAVAEREDNSSTAEFRRFFTDGDDLIFHGGKTFALTKMWGLSAPVCQRRSKIRELYA